MLVNSKGQADKGMLYNNDAADPELGLADVLNPVLPLLRVEE